MTCPQGGVADRFVPNSFRLMGFPGLRTESEQGGCGQRDVGEWEMGVQGTQYRPGEEVTSWRRGSAWVHQACVCAAGLPWASQDCAARGAKRSAPATCMREGPSIPSGPVSLTRVLRGGLGGTRRRGGPERPIWG